MVDDGGGGSGIVRRRVVGNGAVEVVMAVISAWGNTSLLCRPPLVMVVMTLVFIS